VFLPDGHRFLYMMRGATPEKNGIYIASLDGSENRRILADVSGAVFAPPPKGSNASGKLAHILFIRANTLVAQAFDPKIARLAGDVLPIAEGVSITSNASYAPVTASDNGVLLYATGSGQGGARQFAWRDRSGTLTTLIGSAGPVFSPALSPDGRKLVFMRNSSLGASSSADLWVRDLAHNTETRFTTDPSINNTPFWSRNGDRIVFASNRNGAYDLFQKASDGTGRDEPLLITRNSKIVCQWSRDGRFIVYCEYNSKKKSEIWVLPLKGAENERKPVPFLQTEFNEGLAQLSPDSRWMAFTSEQSGRPDVYVRPFPRAGRQWTISASGGQAPRWRGDGKELFFVAADGKLMAVPVKATAAAFETGSTVALFDADLVEEDFFMYDVTADGQHFLITTDGFGVSSPPLNVVVNWNSMLKH
jgi:Tol biopolymer transport system component